MTNTHTAQAAPIADGIGYAVLEVSVFAYGGSIAYNTDGQPRVVMSQDMRDQRVRDLAAEMYG